MKAAHFALACETASPLSLTALWAGLRSRLCALWPLLCDPQRLSVLRLGGDLVSHHMQLERAIQADRRRASGRGDLAPHHDAAPHTYTEASQ